MRKPKVDNLLNGLIEAVAVGIFAGVCWVTLHPALGAAIGTGYVILLANQDAGDGGDEENDAGTR